MSRVLISAGDPSGDLLGSQLSVALKKHSPGLFITALGGADPYVTVAGVELGLGGASYWGLLISMTVLSLYSALLFCWTTPMVEIPSFAQRLVGWAARVGIPAQSAAVSVALALRLCPFLISDFRTLLQTIAQRKPEHKQSVPERINGWAACLPVVCSLAVQNGHITRPGLPMPRILLTLCWQR